MFSAIRRTKSRPAFLALMTAVVVGAVTAVALATIMVRSIVQSNQTLESAGAGSVQARPTAEGQALGPAYGVGVEKAHSSPVARSTSTLEKSSMTGSDDGKAGASGQTGRINPSSGFAVTSSTVPEQSTPASAVAGAPWQAASAAARSPINNQASAAIGANLDPDISGLDSPALSAAGTASVAGAVPGAVAGPVSHRYLTSHGNTTRLNGRHNVAPNSTAALDAAHGNAALRADIARYNAERGAGFERKRMLRSANVPRTRSLWDEVPKPLSDLYRN